MSRIAYVNGRYQPIGAAAVSIEDRGLQFADGVYEVIKAWPGGFATWSAISTASNGRWRRC